MTTDGGPPILPGADTGVSPRQRLAGSPLLPMFDAIEALLFAAGGRAPDDPLVAGYLAGIHMQGERLAAMSGPEAMSTILELVCAGEPRTAYRRRRFVEAAWAGIPEWLP